MASLLSLAMVSTSLPLGTVPAWAQKEKRVALVIGNSKYDVGATVLPNTLNDAKDIGDALEAMQFTVLRGTDLNESEFRNALRRFAQEASTASTAVFFYAGHAMHFDEESYLMPLGVQVEDEAGVRFNMISVEDDVIKKALGRVPVKILILDACRDNPVADRYAEQVAKTRSIGNIRGLAPIGKPASGMLIAYATSPNQVAEDGQGRNSPFSGALKKYIAEPGLEIRDMLKKVKDEVLRSTAERQRPEISDSLSDNVFLSPGESDESAWANLKDTKDAAALAEFIKRFPKSKLVDYAKDKIDYLNLQDEYRRLKAEAAAKDEMARKKAEDAEAANRQVQDALRQKAEAERAARKDAALREAQRQDELRRQEAEKIAAVKAEAVRKEAERQEAARQAAEKLAVAKAAEEARKEAARAEQARLDAQKQEAQRQAQEKLAAAQAEKARQEALRVEAARLAAAAKAEEAHRLEALAKDVKAKEAAAKAAAKAEAERVAAVAKAEAARQADERMRADQERLRLVNEQKALAAKAAEEAHLLAARQAAEKEAARVAEIKRQEDERKALAAQQEALRKAARPQPAPDLAQKEARAREERLRKASEAAIAAAAENVRNAQAEATRRRKAAHLAELEAQRAHVQVAKPPKHAIVRNDPAPRIRPAVTSRPAPQPAVSPSSESSGCPSCGI